MNDTVEYNLNSKVFVELTEKAFEYWLSWYNEDMPLQWQTTIEKLKERLKEGYVEFQFWEFMQIFGSTVVFGKQSIFNITVKIPKEELK